MPLAKNLEELLKHMEPSAAKAQREFWESNPAIAKAVDEGTVPQQEFNRQLNEKDTKLRAAEAKRDEWVDWGNKNKPKHEKLVKDHAELEAKYNTAQDQLKKGVREAVEGTGLDAEELAGRVLEQVKGKTITADQLQGAISAEATRMKNEIVTETTALLDKTRKDFLEKTFPQSVNFTSELVEVMMLNKDEFGQILDRDKLSTYMQENRITSPRQAWDQMVSEARTEKKTAAEVQRRVDAELAKRNIPGVSSSGSTSELGPLQLKIAGETPKFKEGTELGDLSAATMAASEMRTEGLI